MQLPFQKARLVSAKDQELNGKTGRKTDRQTELPLSVMKIPFTVQARMYTRGRFSKVRLSKLVADRSNTMRLSKTTPRRPSSISPAPVEPR